MQGKLFRLFIILEILWSVAHLSCMNAQYLFTYTFSLTEIHYLQPKIDDDSSESLATECPRIIVNPKPSHLGFRGLEVPREALPNITLDDQVVEDIDPRTWAVSEFTPRLVPTSASNPNELHIAEKFRLAFAERDARLAPKRAKNARQRQRRAEKEWMTTSTTAKAVLLASQVSKSLHRRNQ